MPPPVHFGLFSPTTFADFERLLAPVKGCSGCWCMYYRLTSKEWSACQGETARGAMRALVQRGQAHGLLAYRGEEPVGWCTFGPREHFPRLDRIKACQGLDKPAGLWSLPCFFVAKKWRGQGLARQLLAQALSDLKDLGAEIAEAYPVTTTRDGRRVNEIFAWMGPLGIFEQAGFEVVHRANEFRPVVRKPLERDTTCSTHSFVR